MNGFSMSCVDFVAPGVPGTSTICTTSQGILGYVKVAGESTSFEIKSYSSTPSGSAVPAAPWRQDHRPADNDHVAAYERAAYRAPRTSTPGRAPVSSPWSSVTSPRLIVAT